MFLESIKILNGKIYRIALHNQRCLLTRAELLNNNQTIDLQQYVHPPLHMQKGLIKCRIAYHHKIEEVSYQRYIKPKIQTIKLVHTKDIIYKYKTINRPQLDHLYQQKDQCDEMIVVNEGLLTDAYYFNIALCNNGQWFTPKKPLLTGIMRTDLLQKGLIIEKDIHVEELTHYSQISLFNALNEFGEIELDISQIVF